MAQDTGIKNDIRIVKEKLKKFKEINDSFKESMEQLKQKH